MPTIFDTSGDSAQDAEDTLDTKVEAQGTQENAEQSGAEGQDDSQQQASAEEAQQAEKRLWAGKFKTPEELEKAYDNLQRLVGRQGAALGEIEKLKQHLLNADQGQDQDRAAQRDTPIRDQQAQTMQALREQYERDPLGTMFMLAQAAAQQMIQPILVETTGQRLVNEAVRLSQAYEEFNELAPKIAELLNERPVLRQAVLSDPRALEDVFLVVRARAARDAVAAARDAGRAEAEEAIQRKQAAQTAGAGARRQEKSDEEKLLDELFGKEESRSIFG